MTQNFCHRTRREFLWEAGAGFTGVALTGLLAQDGFFARKTEHGTIAPIRLPRGRRISPARPRASSSCSCTAAPARSIPSTTSPSCTPLDGKTIPVKTFGRGGHEEQGRVVGPKWKFKQYGQCGK